MNVNHLFVEHVQPTTFVSLFSISAKQSYIYIYIYTYLSTKKGRRLSSLNQMSNVHLSSTTTRYHNQGVEHEHLKSFLAAYQAPWDPFFWVLFDGFFSVVKCAMRSKQRPR